ncbi:hypothetical protein K438DRAFT_2172443 [Mycena galopus ATCC 62051]|nr:hypothetical protein K438DRAFT_2172443 [Mycena galopus ATCC 62051]
MQPLTTTHGVTGACGETIQNGNMAVAIGEGYWDNGAHCGTTMTVTYTRIPSRMQIIEETNNTQTAARPSMLQSRTGAPAAGCQGNNGIDLAQGAMAAMDPNWYNNGADTVTWSTNYY